MCGFLFFVVLLCMGIALPAADYDLIFRNAQIIDGTGRAAFSGDLAVKGQRIAALGTINGTATKEIDVQGQVLAPGFIDVHTHCERITIIPAIENFVRMGVTTVVTGNCGDSRTDLPKFFEEMAAARIAINVATLVGHNSIRRQVMPDNSPRDPSPSEMEEMKRIVDQAMRDGAGGLSTGLMYLPGAQAKTAEVVELAKIASAYGGIYTTHMRSEGPNIFESLQEVFTIAEEAKIKAQVSHLKLSSPAMWGKAEHLLALLNQAREKGLEITQDQYLYTAAGFSVEMVITQKAREGTLEDFQQLLATPDRKAALIAEMKEALTRQGYRDYSYITIAKFDADPSLNGKSIVEAAKIKRGSDSLDEQIEFIFDFRLKGGGAGTYHVISEEDLKTFLQHPLTMIASDGVPRVLGVDMPHPRSFGNNARAIGRYARDLKVLKLEEVIRKMTSLPAKTFRLKDRGVLKVGNYADLVVFDPSKVNDPATFEDPHHYAVGFSDVVVNGSLILHNGNPTGNRAGVPIRFESTK